MQKILATLVLCWAVAASAEPRRDADEHARRGIALYNLGKYEEAIDEFEQAYTLFQSDALLFNLAQAHRQLQHCERALSYYQRFLEGNPSPSLAAQVESLLPKLQTACRAKLEPPAGPVGPASLADSAIPSTPARDGAAHPGAPARVASADREPAQAAIETTPQPAAAEPPAFAATAALSAGVMVAGQTAPVTAARVTLVAPAAWLHGGQLGAAAAVERLWRGDDLHDATLVEVVAVLQYHSAFDGGRVTVAGTIGALHFGSLDHSSGVVPGVTTAGLWAPVSRGELGLEHAVTRDLAVRVAAGVGWVPRTGAMLGSATVLEVMAGLRYER